MGGAIAHLLLGSPGGQLTVRQVANALADLGLAVTGVDLRVVQTPGSALYGAVAPDGRRLVVKVYGRDAWDNQFLASIWTALIRRGEHPRMGRARSALLEHEALAGILAQRAGVPVPPVVAVGESDQGDAILVTELVGTPLASVTAKEMDNLVPASGWQALGCLHGAGIAHGRINKHSVLALDNGTLVLSDLALAQLAATKDARTTDRARLLVATATVVGQEAAVAAALSAIGTDGMAEVLAYLQPAALDRSTRKAVKAGSWELTALRTAAAAAAGVPPPALVKLQRVTLKSAVVAVFIGLLAVVIINKLLNVDYSSIANELSTANWWWLAAALLIAPTVQVATSFATLGASAKPLRYGPVLMLQYAIGFLAVALPANAARLALEVRFFQRFGLAAAAALSIGIIDSFGGLLVQVLLIALIGLTALPGLTAPLVGASSSSSSDGGSAGTVLIVLAVILVLAAITTAAVPSARRRVLALIPKARATIKSEAASARESLTVLRHPRKIGEMLGGNLVGQVIQAVMLGACLHAFGGEARLSQLILVNTLVSLFAGLMPVPGGVGVAEAGYVAGLQAIGVPSAVAVSAALAYRLVTFYLPPLWGSVAMGWLKRRDYV